MPVVHIYSPLNCPPAGYLAELAVEISGILGIKEEKVWIFWNKKDLVECHKRDWIDQLRPAPVFQITCRAVYTAAELERVIQVILRVTRETLGCDEKQIFISFNRIERGELYAFGEIWK